MPIIGPRALEVVDHQVAAVRLDRRLEALHSRQQVSQRIGGVGTTHHDAAAAQPVGDFGENAGTFVVGAARRAGAHVMLVCSGNGEHGLASGAAIGSRRYRNLLPWDSMTTPPPPPPPPPPPSRFGRPSFCRARGMCSAPSPPPPF